jgi:hypothetical protein
MSSTIPNEQKKKVHFISAYSKARGYRTRNSEEKRTKQMLRANEKVLPMHESA